MNCFGFASCGFAYSLGCPSCGSSQQDSPPPLLEDIHHCFDNRRFSCSWSSGDNQDFFLKAFFYGQLLLGGERQVQILFYGRDGLIHIEGRFEEGKRGQLMDETDHLLLCLVKEREIKSFLGIHVFGHDELVGDEGVQSIFYLSIFDIQILLAVS